MTAPAAVREKEGGVMRPITAPAMRGGEER